MVTPIEELEKYLSKKGFDIENFLRAFGFEDFDDSSQYLGIHEFTTQQLEQGFELMKRINPIPGYQAPNPCYIVGLINPEINEDTFQRLSFFTPDKRRIKHSNPSEYAIVEMDGVFSHLIDYINERVQTSFLAYTVVDEDTVFFGCPDLIRNPEIDLGNGIKILPSKPPEGLMRKRLEELI